MSIVAEPLQGSHLTIRATTKPFLSSVAVPVAPFELQLAPSMLQRKPLPFKFHKMQKDQQEECLGENSQEGEKEENGGIDADGEEEDEKDNEEAEEEEGVYIENRDSDYESITGSCLPGHLSGHYTGDPPAPIKLKRQDKDPFPLWESDTDVFCYLFDGDRMFYCSHRDTRSANCLLDGSCSIAGYLGLLHISALQGFVDTKLERVVGSIGIGY
ncbi:hypothetical protein F5876DRAFT_71116 [Lentinula aff. lateritia]|uniref:Uncharacterized protein n=1 Tax=Lentinula aff. lateritia TaxID=2804960 RepID=A0ACC1TGX6_9AGAR|nr:hypothetical protein F5876DRAFT_71116 [Lentinula aff. lateritia]